MPTSMRQLLRAAALLLPLLLAGCAAGRHGRPPNDGDLPDIFGDAYKSGPQLQLCVHWLPDEPDKSALTRRAPWYEGKLREAATLEEALAKGCDVLVEDAVGGLAYTLSAYTGDIVVGAPRLLPTNDLSLAMEGYDIAAALAPGFKKYDQIVAEREAYRAKKKAEKASGKP